MSYSHEVTAQPHVANPSLQARMFVLRAVNEYRTEVNHIDLDDVYVVWYSYILGGWKAMVATTIPDDHYYEVTHRADGETYLDVYAKVRNDVIPPDDPIHDL